MVPDAVEHDPGEVVNILVDRGHRSVSPHDLDNPRRMQAASAWPFGIGTPGRDVSRSKRVGSLAEPNPFHGRSAVVRVGKPQIIAAAASGGAINRGRQVQGSENRLAPFNPGNAG